MLRELAAAGMERTDTVCVLGGGVAGDLGGFCAAVYQRGVAVVQVPTTVVAQVDSAYGGKTGVDLPEAKNYVGAFHQPAAVFTDPELLATLPAEELRAGFAEILKTALIAGEPLLAQVREMGPLEQLVGDEAGMAVVEQVVEGCLRTKLDVVARDERDTGVRAVAQPRPHLRPRARGGDRLRLLPARGGGGGRVAGRAAPFRAPRRPRPGRARGGGRPAAPSRPRDQLQRPGRRRAARASRRATRSGGAATPTWCCCVRPVTSPPHCEVPEADLVAAIEEVRA